MLRESAAIVSLWARRSLRFAWRISSTAAVVRSRYWRTESIISAGGSANAASPAIPVFWYAIVAARATGPKSAKWKRAQWKRSSQIVRQDEPSARLIARQSRPLFRAAKTQPASTAAPGRQASAALKTTDAAAVEMAKFAPSKIALWGWARRRIECASAATTATAIAVPVSRRQTLASMPIADTLTLPRPYTRTEKSWRTSVSASSVATRPGSCETVSTTVRAIATSTAEATIAEVTTSVVTRSSRDEASADEGSIRASPGRAGRSTGRGRRICTRSSGPGGGDLRLRVVAEGAWAPPLSGGIAPIASDAQDPRPARAFLDPIDHLAADPVHGPHDHDHADVGPEAVDREVRRDPFRQGDHRDVDREVREPERDDDERERQQRQERLEHGVRDAEDRGADQERRPAVDADASPQRIPGPERSGVDRPGDCEAHEPRHGASLGGRRRQWDHSPGMARLVRLALVVLAL